MPLKQQLLFPLKRSLEQDETAARASQTARTCPDALEQVRQTLPMTEEVPPPQSNASAAETYRRIVDGLTSSPIFAPRPKVAFFAQ